MENRSIEPEVATRNPIIEKIRKLQALAERATTEAEAAVAATRVQELLAKHNLELGSVALSEDPGGEQEVGRGWGRLPSHAVSLARACQWLFDVMFYFRGSRIGGYRFVFIGIQANVEAACITYEYLLASVDALTRGAKSEGLIYGAEEFLAFRIGAADRIRELAREHKAQTVAANPSYGELVHIGDAVARRLHDAKQFSGSSRGGSGGFMSYGNSGYDLGYEQGSRVDLHGARTNRLLGGGK